MTPSKKKDESPIVIKPPKPRVKTPLKTGTVIHKSPKTYTRKIKHKKRPEDAEEAENG